LWLRILWSDVMKPLKSAFFTVLCLGSVSVFAQSLGNTCVSIAGTHSVTAPMTGSITFGPLTRYGNNPAQVCTNITLGAGFTSLSMDYLYTTATTFNAVTIPTTSSNCLGAEVKLNGGPIYSAAQGRGSFAISLSGAAPTGTMQATGFAQAENLQVTVGGQTYSISTPLHQFAATVTLNADGSSDTELCIPNTGVAATVNGAPAQLSAPIWQCINPPAADPKQRVRYRAC
jgi:hypothetical protein